MSSQAITSPSPGVPRPPTHVPAPLSTFRWERTSISRARPAAELPLDATSLDHFRQSIAQIFSAIHRRRAHQQRRPFSDCVRPVCSFRRFDFQSQFDQAADGFGAWGGILLFSCPCQNSSHDVSRKPSRHRWVMTGGGSPPRFLVCRYCFLHYLRIHKMQAEGKRPLPPRL